MPLPVWRPSPSVSCRPLAPTPPRAVTLSEPPHRRNNRLLPLTRVPPRRSKSIKAGCGAGTLRNASQSQIGASSICGSHARWWQEACLPPACGKFCSWAVPDFLAVIAIPPTTSGAQWLARFPVFPPQRAMCVQLTLQPPQLPLPTATAQTSPANNSPAPSAAAFGCRPSPGTARYNSPPRSDPDTPADEPRHTSTSS